MQLKIDLSRPYALALEGGGAKGAYQIGAWRALRESGVNIRAVSGTSVGALNGALIAMGNLERAEDVWKNIRYSKVMDVNDETMSRLIRGDLKDLDLREVARELGGVLKNRGFDVAPLMNWMKEVVTEEGIRASDTELFIVTYSLTDQKVLELRARELPDGALWDMLLASAYLPVFRNEPLGGKRYADGGVRDVLPLHVLIENGYEDIIALRLYGFGVERPVQIPKTTRVTTISPTAELGGTLEFDALQSRQNLLYGYYDTLRFLYGLAGRQYYIDTQWDEREAYDFLAALARRHPECPATLRALHETFLPTLARKLDAGAADYREMAAALLEEAALAAGIEKFAVYTETQLLSLLPAGALDAALGSVLERRRAGDLLHRLEEAAGELGRAGDRKSAE